MSHYNEIVEQIAAYPENTSIRMKLAERLSGDGNVMGEIIRLQCEVDELTEQDAGWYWRSFKLANLLRGTNPFLAAFVDESNESVWTSELHAIKHDGKSVGHGKIERGIIETYAVFDVVRMKACEQAVMSAAPLIRNFEFSDLRTTEHFDAFASLDAISHATGLRFSKCHFPTGEFERILNLKQCGLVVGLAFAECTFDDGVDALLRTNVAKKVQRLVITLDREQAAEFGRERSYLGDLFTSGNLPSLLSLELDQCCFTEDLIRMADWRGLDQLVDLKLGAHDWTANAFQDFLRNDLNSLESLQLSRIRGELRSVELGAIPRLRLFSLKGPTLCSEAMLTLSGSVADSLQHLTLANCTLTTSSLDNLLHGAELPSLRYLNLQLNELDGNAVEQIVATPWLENLIALKLSFNRLGSDAAGCLANSTVMKNLAFLDLSETELGDVGAQQIAMAPAANLQWLNLDANAITSDSLSALLDLRQMTNLVALRLKGNDVFNVHKQEFVERFGEDGVNSYWLGYLV